MKKCGFDSTSCMSYKKKQPFTGVIQTKVFSKITQTSQENTCNRVLFLKINSLEALNVTEKGLNRKYFPFNFVIFKDAFYYGNSSGHCFCAYFAKSK